MKAITSIKFALSLTGLTLTGLLSPAAVHAAQLTYDMRIVNSSISGAVTGDSQHNFTAAANGEVLTVDIYALVQGSADQDLSNDGFVKAVGGFISTGTLLGNFRGDPTGGAKTQTNNVAPFAYLNGGVQSGFTSDLDGDGDLDVGSNVTTGNPAPVPWFVANSDKNGTGFDPYFGSGTGTGPAAFLIGETTFTITGGIGSTTLQFVPRFKSDGTLLAKKLDVIYVDGTEVDLNGNSPEIAEIGATILIPEPSAIGMLLLGTLGLVGFRRSAFRRLIIA
jgi:hypothetical protein